ncbi:MAG: UDP-N-acetylmuramoyl-tripeptide--D-alanyl-D-alanine ligase [Planctomycetota bacterium]
MIPLHLHEIINAVKGEIRNYKPLLIDHISTDSRTITKDGLFIALKGDRFDGHNFLTQAIKQGAAAVLVSRIPEDIKDAEIPVVKVKDTLLALGDIAGCYRRRLTVPVIAVGGSNGKTTTKDMIAHILSKKAIAAKSYKSFNNFIGLPLTIFSADRKTDYLVAEVGTNKPGEIKYLSKILKPDIAVITNISATHLDGLKNPEGVFKEESQLFRTLKSGAIAVFDPSNKDLKRLAEYAEYKSVTFGIDSDADVTARDVKTSQDGIGFTIFKGESHYECFIPVLGSWNIKNALAAFAVAQLLGLRPEDICRALKDFKLPEMRMDRRLKGGVTFINDAYNANPVSVGLAIDELSAMETAGRKILVFGEMRELGRYSRRFHEEAAGVIASSRIDLLIIVGKDTRYTANKLSRIGSWDKRMLYYETVYEAISSLKKILKPGDTVLLKGSRANALEKIII